MTLNDRGWWLPVVSLALSCFALGMVVDGIIRSWR